MSDCGAVYLGTPCEWGAGHPPGTDSEGNYADHGAPSKYTWWTSAKVCNRCMNPQPCGCYSDEAHLGLPFPSDPAVVLAAWAEHDRENHRALSAALAAKEAAEAEPREVKVARAALDLARTSDMDHDWALRSMLEVAGLLDAAAERDELRAQVLAVEALHQPRTGTVYSFAHHEAEHESEDDRCSDACFEPWVSCNADGSAWPCSTTRALAAAAPSEPQED